MRPYHQIPIVECGEPLVRIPLELFAVESPHPYEKLGAPYGENSPYYLRRSVIESLIQAQNYLQLLHPNWQIQIFDAYRPVAVQQFMVDYSFASEMELRGLTQAQLSPNQNQEIWEAVYQIWAVPSLDEKTPPPHSTGAAVDITLVDDRGKIVNMGSPIDELSERSHPDYYANTSHPEAQNYHAHRQLLRDIMLKAGFQRNPKEWWHFSDGDQMWAWVSNQANPANSLTARYGRLV
ncbi:MAG: D-alanyl-D-alanine dipeptidase [Goleter apudmare HA4340-LM2]|jgi:D-alanyl-D-alanine dipeptidase|nr:D-alanyl-D-alanine dipeptidase [Goleter apudmare HA4340-LM2]